MRTWSWGVLWRFGSRGAPRTVPGRFRDRLLVRTCCLFVWVWCSKDDFLKISNTENGNRSDQSGGKFGTRTLSKPNLGRFWNKLKNQWTTDQKSNFLAKRKACNNYVKTNVFRCCSISKNCKFDPEEMLRSGGSGKPANSFEIETWNDQTCNQNETKTSEGTTRCCPTSF